MHSIKNGAYLLKNQQEDPSTSVPFLGVFRGMVFKGYSFLGAVFKASRRPKIASTKNCPQKPPLYKTFDRFTGPALEILNSVLYSI